MHLIMLILCWTCIIQYTHVFVHLEVDDEDWLWVVKHIKLPKDLRKLSAVSEEKAGKIQLAAVGWKAEKHNSISDMCAFKNHFISVKSHVG